MISPNNYTFFPIQAIRELFKVGVLVKNKETLKTGRINELSYLRDYVMVAYSNTIEDHFLENIETLEILERKT